MSVPGHDERDFEFAKKYAIPGSPRDCACRSRRPKTPELPFVSEDGVLVELRRVRLG